MMINSVVPEGSVPYLRKGHDFQSRDFRLRGQRVPMNLRSSIMARVVPMQDPMMIVPFFMAFHQDDEAGGPTCLADTQEDGLP